MAAMPVYGKNLSKIFFWTRFGMEHVGAMMNIFYIFRKVWITNVPAIPYSVKNNKKMVKISVLIIFQGKWFEKCEA